MSIGRRVPFAGLLFLGSAFLAAQTSEVIENWSAPPYWMPVRVSKPEGPGEKLAPEEAAAVPTAPLAFTGISPCRLADTRGNGFTGQYGPPQITPAGRDVTITGQCGIPGGAQAVSFSFSAINIPGNGFFVAYPAGGAFPPVATMAYGPSTPVISNAAVVPLGTAGAVTVVAAVVNVDLTIDVNGYYAPQTVVNTVNGLSGAVTLAQGTNVTITPSGNTLTIAATGDGSGWSLTGNAGTTPGTNFLGTTDNQALEVKVNNARAFRIEPTSGAPNVIGGHVLNSVTAGVVGATIAGGGLLNGNGNVVTDDYGVIGGGFTNRAGDLGGTTSDREAATVGGGVSNIANGGLSFIGGGQANTTNQFYGAIGGGAFNVTSGYAATVPGGLSNTALGDQSLAAGYRAKANHTGAFVWGDTTVADVASTGTNQFIVRASGGIWLGTTSTPSITIASDFLNTSTGAHLTIGGAWTNSSDFDRKQYFEPIDNHDVLARVASLPISRWSYKAESRSVRHIGPTGQDFATAFGLGSDDKSIATVDADGVALASIQALYEMVKEKDTEIDALKARLSKLEAKLE